jgi:ABC transporter substrate binding protein (PQQ-dependent alcohol dehydrogenase system)
VKDVTALARAANASLQLDHKTLSEEEDVAKSVAALLATAPTAILLDLPHDDLLAVGKSVPSGTIALINIRDPADDLRSSLCATSMFHAIPSRAMLDDALAQFVVAKNWKKILLLTGPELDDQILAQSFMQSAKKFGAKIVDTKPFVAGNDPRKREQTSTALMTGDSDYDVVYVADSTGDFGRFVQFRQVKPRPVIGSEGLVASAWHRAAERYGAPQVNHRFERENSGRPMSDRDWSAWVSVKSVVEAVARSGKSDPQAVAKILAEGGIDVEMTKGMPGSFRSWDRQLRQPIMLHTADAIVTYAPIEGFLHEKTVLDTLGMGEKETACKR